MSGSERIYTASIERRQVDDEHSIPLRGDDCTSGRHRLGGDSVEGVDIFRELMRIEKKLEDIEKLLNELLEREESYTLMKLSEESLREFLADEPDIYSEEDLKVRYK